MQAENKKEEHGNTLDQMFANAKRPNVFSHEAVLHAIAQFVACDDQVSQSS
jgi:hypothetical protein